MTSTHITYDLPRAVDHSVATQRYFLLALSTVADVRIAREPLLTKPLRRVEDKLGRVYDLALLRQRSHVPFLATRNDAGLTGRYEADVDGRAVRFAIDARDQPEIFDEDALEWSDVYFKANHWPSRDYNSKVEPLVNGNGFFTPARIRRLRELRNRPKDLDVAFVTNVWGGREHVVRVYEELARLSGPNALHAVFPWGFEREETDTLKRRLESAGVRTSDKPVPLDELTETMARARVVFFRAGKHLCLPWRTLDVLAMGACIVMDAVPYPQWYAPLCDGVHYVACGVSRPEDTSPAPDAEYDRIVTTVEALLADQSRAAELRHAAARYFDEHASPDALGAHILDRLRASLARARRTIV